MKNIDIMRREKEMITIEEQEKHNRKYHLVTFDRLVTCYIETKDNKLRKLQENTMFNMLLQSQLNDEESRERLKLKFREIEIEDKRIESISLKRKERDEKELNVLTNRELKQEHYKEDKKKYFMFGEYPNDCNYKLEPLEKDVKCNYCDNELGDFAYNSLSNLYCNYKCFIYFHNEIY